MKYTLEVERKEDGTMSMHSTNDGFNAFELMGIMAFKLEDIREQVTGKIKPDVISRKVIDANL